MVVMAFGRSLAEVDADLYERCCRRFTEAYAATRNSYTGSLGTPPAPPEIRLGDQTVQINLFGDSTSYDWNGDLSELEALCSDAAVSYAESNE